MTLSRRLAAEALGTAFLLMVVAVPESWATDSPQAIPPLRYSQTASQQGVDCGCLSLFSARSPALISIRL